MALILADRVRELTATTGTGSVTLIGSPDGFETFAASIGDGNTTYYTIAEKTGDNWEVGVGTYRSAGNLLERTTVLSSSNGGNKVAFAAGDKDVFVTLPAEKVVSTDAAGTMAYQNANSVAITGGAINGTTIGSTTPAAATFTTLTATGQTSLGGSAGGEGLRVTTTASANRYVQVAGGVFGASSPTIGAAGGASGLSVYANGGSPISFLTNGAGGQQLSIAHTASAVNYVQVTGAATTAAPVISAAGSDTNVPMIFSTKGTGAFSVWTGGNKQFQVANTASAANHLEVTGAIATAAPILRAIGSDTNIDLALTTKGTGAVNFNTGTGKQVYITDQPFSTGATTVNNLRLFGGQTGYSVGFGAYGSDSNVTLAQSSKGSNAIAFYTGTFGAQQMAVSHTASAVNYVQVTGAATGASPYITAQGSDANINLSFASKGTNGIFFRTNGTTIQFAVTHTSGTIANYGTARGAVSGSAPIFSVEGSDANIDLALTPKGTGLVRFGTLTATADTAISGYITIKDSGGTTRKLAVIT